MDAKSGYLLSGDVTRSSPVLYRESQSIDAHFAHFTTHALLPIFLEDTVLGTTVNPDTCGRGLSHLISGQANEY